MTNLNHESGLRADQPAEEGLKKEISPASSNAASTTAGSVAPTNVDHVPKPAQFEKPSERCFVTKIPNAVSAEELTAYFEQFGRITDVHMPKNPGKLGHKGIAFVSFSDGEIARNVRDMQLHTIKNQKIIVDHATPRNPEVSAGRKAETKRLQQLQKKDGMDEYYEYMMGPGNYDKAELAGGSGSGGGGPSRSPAGQFGYDSSVNTGNAQNGSWNTGFAPAPLGSSGQDRNGGNGSPGQQYESNRVFVTKIESDITKQNLVEYFTQFGQLEDCYMPAATNPSQPHKGIAFVSFRDVRVANHVLKRPSYEIKPGQFIVVDKANMRQHNNRGGGISKGSPQGGQRSGPY